MSSVAQGSRISQNKMDLAQELYRPRPFVEQTLARLFDAIINQLAKKSTDGLTMHDFISLREDLWSQTSSDRLNKLERGCLLLYCQHVLARFDEEEIQNMLQDWRRENSLLNPNHARRLENAWRNEGQKVFISTEEQARRMTGDWVPDIVAHLKIRNQNLNIAGR